MTKRDELIALGGVGVKVRELEWHEITAARSDEDPSHEPTGDYEAVSSIGVYFIEMYFGSDSYGWSVSLNSDFVSDHDDPCAAKAAAQADYEQRIRSALEINPVLDADPLERKTVGRHGSEGLGRGRTEGANPSTGAINNDVSATEDCQEPELMALLATDICISIDEVIKALEPSHDQ